MPTKVLKLGFHCFHFLLGLPSTSAVCKEKNWYPFGSTHPEEHHDPITSAKTHYGKENSSKKLKWKQMWKQNVETCKNAIVQTKIIAQTFVSSSAWWLRHLPCPMGGPFMCPKKSLIAKIFAPKSFTNNSLCMW